MAEAAKATISLHLDTTGIVEQLRGLADAIEATTTPKPTTTPKASPLVDYGHGPTPYGLVVSEDGSLINWLGENYVRQSEVSQ